MICPACGRATSEVDDGIECRHCGWRDQPPAADADLFAQDAAARDMRMARDTIARVRAQRTGRPAMPPKGQTT
jgi:ribosomal protein L37AE/L43A